MIAIKFQATRRVKEHKPCGYAYKVVTPYSDYDKEVVVYRDNGTGDVAENFILEMYEEYDRLHDLIWADEEMEPLTLTQQQNHDSAVTCYLCEEPLSSDQKTRDHCHYTWVLFTKLHKKILLTFANTNYAFLCIG